MTDIVELPLCHTRDNNIIGLLGLAVRSWINTMDSKKKKKTRLGLMSNVS